MVNSISLNGEVVDSKEETRVDSISLSGEMVGAKEAPES